MDDLSTLPYNYRIFIVSVIFFIVFVVMGFLIDRDKKEITITPILDILFISLSTSLLFFVSFVFSSKILIWFLLYVLMWFIFVLIGRYYKEKSKINSTEITKKPKKINFKKELNDYRIVQKHKERRRKFGEDELNQLIGYIVYNKDRVKKSNRYDSSVVDIFNEMYQDGLKKEKSNSQIVEEIDDFFESRLSRNLSYDMNERFRTLFTKLEGISYLDEDETEVKVEKIRRTTIPQSVKDRVWNRDGGKCVQCGSNEKIEFDHIIPFSKGGTDTYRNLQILCEKCNRSKSDKIG